ncbi:hypothetical protein N7513_006883 [Penicillium frequentans]|nr:hypothetical protein N7513_006883 [Penicillium glabrum]
MASSFSTTPATLWSAPSHHGYKYPLPIYPPSNIVLISTQTSPKFPLTFRRLSFSLLLVSCVEISRTLRTPNISKTGIISESSYTSPIDTDNNRSFELDSSKTDLTELERSPLASQMITRKKLSLKTRT